MIPQAYETKKTIAHMKHYILVALMAYLSVMTIDSMQAQEIKDNNTPLHLIQPDYPIPYGTVSVASAGSDIDRVFRYLNEVTPYELVDSRTDEVVKNLKRINPHLRWKKGDYRLLSYEWGVAYAGMLASTEATGNPKYEQ